MSAGETLAEALAKADAARAQREAIAASLLPEDQPPSTVGVNGVTHEVLGPRHDPPHIDWSGAMPFLATGGPIPDLDTEGPEPGPRPHRVRTALASIDPLVLVLIVLQVLTLAAVIAFR